MTPDWAQFTPWTSLAGGLLIGLAAAALILGSGRMLGAAGIAGGGVDPPPRAGGGGRGVRAGRVQGPLAPATSAGACGC